MITTVYSKDDKFQWLDIIEPTPEEIQNLAEKYSLHPTSLHDCLDPEHLPKYERIGDLNFIILRAHDEVAVPDADTIQELTRKIAIFFTPKFVITIHRKDQPYFVRLREKWKTASHRKSTNLTADLIAELLHSIIESYEPPIDHALGNLEQLEMAVFEAQGAKKFKIKQAYFLKRKAFVFKRMLRMMADLLPKINATLDLNPQEVQNLKEHADSLYFYTEELTESVTSLLNLHISLSSQKTNEASHRTNEVVRVLTIFSVFLLPLNVVTGIYGMNFEHMPELKSTYGYPIALGSMIFIVLAIYTFFRKRGWLR